MNKSEFVNIERLFNLATQKGINNFKKISPGYCFFKFFYYLKYVRFFSYHKRNKHPVFLTIFLPIQPV